VHTSCARPDAGDPTSTMLFVVDMEVLMVAIKKSVHESMFSNLAGIMPSQRISSSNRNSRSCWRLSKS
jgi:hypothetical protein